MQFINLTPHGIVVFMGEGRISFAPTGAVARVATQTVPAGTVGGIPCFKTAGGEVTGLPEQHPLRMLIVSSMVRMACPERLDLVSPGELVRDENGRPVGCQGLTING